jgi:asparagine synthase (glutamine-hydrolysing)
VCGIAGAVWRQGQDRPLIRAMTARLRHRGPDDEAYWFSDAVALGFRRLSIIDPEHGRQPVSSHAGEVVAVCNGEIYNHSAHRERLGALGHRFASGSDAEVVPHLHGVCGTDFPSELEGKFALASYDARKDELVLARDRLGIKPLYYIDAPSGFFFASEIKSLLLVPGFTPHVDRRALDLLLTFKHIPAGSCLLEGVRLLLPGHLLVYDVRAHTWHLQQFYQIPDRPVGATMEQAAAEVRSRFDRAVRSRLMSDVPIGVSLSGGLDSSAVVASVALQSDRPPRTYSVDVGDDWSEMPFARMVAERYRTDHHEIRVVPEDVHRITPTVMWHLEEPLSISEIPTFYLGRAVGRHVKVLLCGEGSDELFGGYKRFLPIQALSWLPRPALEWGYVRGLNGLTRRDRLRLYAPAQRALAGPDGNPYLRAALDGRGPVLNRLLRYELSHQLRSQVLRLDKLTMAHGVEARCPFLDPDLVDYVANLPAGLKVRGVREKAVLKAAMADRLPREVIERRKFGFSNPVKALFRNGFGQLCRESMRADRDVLADYFQLSAVERLFDAIGPRPGLLRLPEMQLFHIYLFAQWHHVFVEGQVPAPLGPELRLDPPTGPKEDHRDLPAA